MSAYCTHADVFRADVFVLDDPFATPPDLTTNRRKTTMDFMAQEEWAAGLRLAFLPRQRYAMLIPFKSRNRKNMESREEGRHVWQAHG